MIVTKLRFAKKAIALSLHIALGVFLVTILGFWLPHKKSFLLPHSAFKRNLIRYWHKRACKILNIDLSISGTIPQQPCLVVSNHISWLDIIVIGSQIPVHFLSKSEVRQWPIIGWLAACVGTLFIQRGNGKSAQMAEVISTKISMGDSVLVFPEATSTNGSQTKRFFPNMFAAATKNNIDVLPLAIKYSEKEELSTTAPFIDDDTFFNHLLLVLNNNDIDVKITFLPAILHNADIDKKTLSTLSRNAILQVIQPTRYDNNIRPTQLSQ